jgi:hypothetical protein
MRFANLKRQRHSAFRRYAARYMTHTMEGVRLVGFIVMAAGARMRLSPATYHARSVDDRGRMATRSSHAEEFDAGVMEDEG